MAVLDYPVTAQQTEEQQIRELYRALLHGGTVNLVDPYGASHPVPASVSALFRSVLAGMQEGKGVVVVPVGQELTTKQAADLLGVCRQYLVRLLERGQLAFHRTGTHRRIYLNDLLLFRAERDHNRHRAIERIAHQEMQDGTYDEFIPPE